MRGSRGIIAAALLVIAILLVAAGPAAAKSRAPRTLGPIEGRQHIGHKEERSTNWSGYAAYGQTFTSASGTWVQPEANCSLKGRQVSYAAFWVGLDGYESKTVEQTGTEADCEGTHPYYFAWYELYPQRSYQIKKPVEAGDVFHATVTQAKLELTDETAGWTEVVNYPSKSLEFSSAEWIAEAVSNRFTDFGSVHFSEASASTATSTGPISDWENDNVLLVSGRGRNTTTLAEPEPLELGGSAFTITQP